MCFLFFRIRVVKKIKHQTKESILHLVLTNDTDCLKANLVLLVAVPENFFQTIEILQPAIKSLMACSSPTKKLLQGSAMLWIGSGHPGICIGTVTNGSSVWRDLLLEFFFENCQVMIGSWKGPLIQTTLFSKTEIAIS
jgi:hypothetical protein